MKTLIFPKNKFIQLLLTSIAKLSNEVNSKAIGILIFKFVYRKKSLNLLFAIKTLHKKQKQKSFFFLFNLKYTEFVY